MKDRRDPYLIATKTVDAWRKTVFTVPSEAQYDQLKFAIAILVRDEGPVQKESPCLHIEVSEKLGGLYSNLNGSREHLLAAIVSLLDDQEAFRSLFMDAFKIHMLNKLKQQFNGQHG